MMRQGRGSEATKPVFFPIRRAKKHLRIGVRTGCRYLISLFVCLSVCLYVCLSVSVCICNIRRFHRSRELHEADVHKPGIYGSGRVWANAWDVFRRAPSRGGRGRRAAVYFVLRFGCGFFFRVFFCFFFFERTRPAESIRPSCLIYLSASTVIVCIMNV